MNVGGNCRWVPLSPERNWKFDYVAGFQALLHLETV